MKNIERLPMYMPGQVIDITYKHTGIPNRILVEGVYITEKDNEWMYICFAENLSNKVTLKESFITSRKTCKSANVYKTREVIGLYADGWRFCGNFDIKNASNVASKHAMSKHIKNVILRPALNAGGNTIKDQYGIWIKHYTTISDDGRILDNEEDQDIIIIK